MSDGPGEQEQLAPNRSAGEEGRIAPLTNVGRKPRPSRRRVWLARILALTADAVQFALLPVVIGGAVSPIDDVIDAVTGVALTALLGFHWAFLPTFLAKLVPFVDMVPSWTLAVFITTRDKSAPAAASARAPTPLR
ncbi:MAG TPA: hypothetical protein VGP07_13075 [Polyangia bacterium]